MHVMLIPYLLGAEATPLFVRQKFPDRSALELGANKAWDLIHAGAKETGADTIVLSSEHLGDLTAHPNFAAGIARLSSLADELHVVAYVRSPTSEYVSYAQEQLKAGRMPFRPDQMASAKDRLAPLTQLSAVKMSVQPFVRSLLIGEDIRSDFVTRYLPEGAMAALDSNTIDKNQSISAEAMAVLECYVSDIFPDGFRKLGELNYHTMRKLSSLDSDLPGYARPKYLPGVAQEIHRVARDLDWLAENFGVIFSDSAADLSRADATTPQASSMTRVRDYCIVDDERFLRLLGEFQMQL